MFSILLAAALASPSPVPSFAPDDERLAVEALLALAGEERLAPYRVEAAVAGGVVTLLGLVPTAQERDVAERALRGVLGRVAVENRIEVHPVVPWVPPARRDDRAVEYDALVALRQTPDAEAVVPVCRNGHLALRGEVAGLAALAAAVRAAREVRGVRSVRSTVEVRSGTSLPPRERL